MKWPFVKRSTMEASIKAAQWEQQVHFDNVRTRLEEEWAKKWQPILSKAINLKVERRYDTETFVLHIGVDRNLMEMAAGYNDQAVWDYLADQLTYELRRQISTLNFAGLHRLAYENENRYPRSHYPFK